MKYQIWFPNRVSVPMRGIIHIGAHIGQEHADYLRYGLKHIMYFEPVPETFKNLVGEITGYYDDYILGGKVTNNKDGVETILINQALGNTVGEIEMFIETANNGQSSSILEADLHLKVYPQITFDNKITVKINKLDNFDCMDYNALNIDVQGYELEVLKGAEKTLNGIDVIFTEINTKEVYKGCAKLNELDEFLKDFERVYTHEWDGIGYGDAIYVRK